MTTVATRAQAFGTMADAVAAGLNAPWRMYLAHDCRYLSLNVADCREWNSWRAHLGYPELSVRVYDSGGAIRRVSTSEIVLDDRRISVELIEEVSLDDLDGLLSADATSFDSEEE